MCNQRRHLIVIPAILLGLLLPGMARSQVTIQKVTPPTLTIGQPMTVTFSGKNLGSVVAVPELWTSFAAKSELMEKVGPNGEEKATWSSVRFRVTPAKTVTAGTGIVRSHSPLGPSDPWIMMLDHLATTNVIPSRELPQAPAVYPPVAIQGTTDKLAAQYFRIHGQPGDILAIEIYARRLNSPMDPVLRLLDGQGRVLAHVDDTVGLGGDCRLTHVWEDMRMAYLEIRDIDYRKDLPYRVRLASVPLWGLPDSRQSVPANQDFPSSLALGGQFDTPEDRNSHELKLSRHQWLTLSTRTRSMGSPAWLRTILRDPSGHIVLEGGRGNAVEETLYFKAPTTGRYRLEVSELIQGHGPTYHYTLDVSTNRLPVLLKLNQGNKQDQDRHLSVPGGLLRLELQCERKGYQGPINLSVEGPRSPYTILKGTIAANEESARLEWMLPQDHSPEGLIHVSVQGRARLENRDYAARLETSDYLRRTFSQLPRPPKALDGLIPIRLAPRPWDLSLPKAPLTLTDAAESTGRIEVSLNLNPAWAGELPKDLKLAWWNLPDHVNGGKAVTLEPATQVTAMTLKTSGKVRKGVYRDVRLKATATVQGHPVAWLSNPLTVEIQPSRKRGGKTDGQP